MWVFREVASPGTPFMQQPPGTTPDHTHLHHLTPVPPDTCNHTLISHQQYRPHNFHNCIISPLTCISPSRLYYLTHTHTHTCTIHRLIISTILLNKSLAVDLKKQYVTQPVKQIFLQTEHWIPLLSISVKGNVTSERRYGYSTVGMKRNYKETS